MHTIVVNTCTFCLNRFLIYYFFHSILFIVNIWYIYIFFLFLVISNRWHEEPQCGNPVIEPITYLLVYTYLSILSEIRSSQVALKWTRSHLTHFCPYGLSLNVFKCWDAVSIINVNSQWSFDSSSNAAPEHCVTLRDKLSTGGRV